MQTATAPASPLDSTFRARFGGDAFLDQVRAGYEAQGGTRRQASCSCR